MVVRYPLGRDSATRPHANIELEKSTVGVQKHRRLPPCLASVEARAGGSRIFFVADSENLRAASITRCAAEPWIALGSTLDRRRRRRLARGRRLFGRKGSQRA